MEEMIKQGKMISGVKGTMDRPGEYLQQGSPISLYNLKGFQMEIELETFSCHIYINRNKIL
jgi:hypothetical protein